MKLSMKLIHLAETERESLRMIKTAGFDGIDFSFYENMQDKEKFLSEENFRKFSEQAKMIREEGLEICQCHLPYLNGERQIQGIPYPEYEACFLPMMIRSLELCHEMECHVAVIHLYFVRDPQVTYESNLCLMKKLLPYLEKYDVTLAIENIYGGGSKYENSNVSFPEDILRYVTEMNHPRIGICLDTGHANIFHLDVVEMARKYGKYLVATHIHSNTGQDDHLIPGTIAKWHDPTDYRRLAQVMQENGYSGSFNLEINLAPLPKSAQKAFVQLAYDAAIGFFRE